MKHKKSNVAARRRALALPHKVKAKYAVELAALEMGLVEWDDVKEAYCIGDQDVTHAMERLAFDAKVIVTCKLRDPRQTSGVRYVWK